MYWKATSSLEESTEKRADGRQYGKAVRERNGNALVIGFVLKRNLKKWRRVEKSDTSE